MLKLLFKKIKGDNLLKPMIIFLIGSFSVGILNYLYHLFMGRMLGPSDYGILGSLFAILYLAGFAGGTFSKVISKYTSEFNNKEQEYARKYIIRRGLFKVLIYGLIVLCIYFIFIPKIAHFMGIEGYTGLILIGIIGYFSIIESIIIGALNGLQKFAYQNALPFISSTIKICLAVFLVYKGFGVNGALVPILIGSSITLSLGILLLRKELNFKIREKIDTRKIYIYAIPVLIASILPLITITLDQILVKHLFSSIEAGYYAAAGNIAKIIWFGSGFLGFMIFPKIVQLRAQKKEVSKLLIRGLAYTSFFALIGSGILMAAPRSIILIMYGSAYLSISPFVGIFGLTLGLFSINQILIIFNLALEKYKFLWIIFAGVLLEIVGIFIFHSSLTDIVKINLLTQLFILIGILIYNRKEIIGGTDIIKNIIKDYGK